MSRPTSWSDLRGRRVVVWGVGVEGQATLRRLEYLGVEPVLVDRESRQLPTGELVLPVDAPAGRAALLGADVVVKSPGISRYDDLAVEVAEVGVEVMGGMGLWLAEADRARVLCVTGTKGKSTTTAIAGSLARGLGHDCFVGGNLGIAPWDPAVERDFAWWVVEVSSYQATDVVVGPRTVAVTSLSQDHLTWHRGVTNYFRDKLSLCTRPGVEAVVANGSDTNLRAREALLGPAVDWVTEPAGEWASGLQLVGMHNLRNAAVARAALVHLGVPGADDDALLAVAAAAYEPLPSRLTVVGHVAGVEFVDDGLSTNVLPTLAAVDAFAGRRIALLVGGFDRGIEYASLARGLAGRRDVLVLTMPDNGERIAAALEAEADHPDIHRCRDLVDAVHAGFAWARPEGVVLLSPAAPSFGHFTDYRDRGAAFAAAMRSIAAALPVADQETPPPVQ